MMSLQLLFSFLQRDLNSKKQYFFRRLTVGAESKSKEALKAASSV